MRVVLGFGLAALAFVLVNASPAYAEATVPEPASMALLGTAAVALGVRAFRNRSRNR